MLTPAAHRPPPHTTQSEKQQLEPVEFQISPKSLENVKKASAIPEFSITGKLNKTNCSLSAAFTGEITVVQTAAKIKSIELQLVRVETVTPAGVPPSREATEIQNLQIGDGNVCLNLAIPLYMVFPRVFTCPTVITDIFRVEFEVNVIVVFEEGFVVTDNHSVRLYRAPVVAVAQ